MLLAAKCRCKQLEVRPLCLEAVRVRESEHRTTARAASVFCVLPSQLPRTHTARALPFFLSPPREGWEKSQKGTRQSYGAGAGFLYQSRNHSRFIVPNNLSGAGESANWHRFISSLHKASEQKRKLAHNNPSPKSEHNLTLGFIKNLVLFA